MTAMTAPTDAVPPVPPRVGPVVGVEHLGKTFPGVRAVHDVTVTFQPGTVHALVGQNGAGKSSIIKILAGAQRADDGTITIDGEPARFSSPLDSARHGLAFIHQEPNLVDDLTVAENVVLGTPDGLRVRYLVDRRAMRRRYTELAARLGLDVHANTPVAELGVAEQTLVAIARALHRDAHFLVFDEPTAALSDVESERLFAIIGDLRREGRTVVYVSHRLHEVFRLAQTVTVLKDGQLVTTVPTASLAHRDELVSLILGTGNMDAAADIDLALPSAVEDPADTGSPGPDHATVAPGEPLLRVTHLSDGGRVRDASFELYAGRITGMAGLVGAGRSEVAAMLCGATRPRSGEIVLDGDARRFRSPRAGMRAGVALVPEDRRHLGAMVDLDVRENLTMPFLTRFNATRFLPVLVRRRETKWAHAAVDRLSIKISGLDQPIVNLSGGNQQKVIVSRWVGAGARVFVFDEPTQGVDVGARAEIYAVMRELANDGAAVLMISSDMEEVVAVSDDVVVMREGRTVAHLATPDESAILRACYGHEPFIPQTSAVGTSDTVAG
ncbi:MAG: sugar transporter ATP-binding protein [Nocardioidaceae bacterium]|nr:sugar transporter ATP-binding protein [Nocardioidaceae bacterium]